MLISHYKPLWKFVVEGFSNHLPGGGRGKGKRPSWDVIHLGGQWANNLEGAVTSDDVLTRIAAHIKKVSIPPADIEL